MPVDKQYADFVRSLARSGDGRTFLNSDEDKAVEVLVNLFQISTEEVRIFAGNLCEHVGDKPEYIIALSEFVERGGKLFILLNNYDKKKAEGSNLFKRLAYFKSLGKPIFIKSTPAHPYIVSDKDKKEVHFTVGDRKAFRIETDFVNRTAVCNFNLPKMADETAKFFDSLFEREDATEIDIENLFEDGDK